MPSPPEAIQAANELLAAGRLDDASATLRRILQRQPRHAEANTLMAMVMIRQGQPERSVYFAEKAAAASPANPLVRNTLAVALTATGKLSRAVDEYRETIRLMPGWMPPWINLGSTLIEAGRPDEAAEAIEHVLRTTSGDPLTLKNYGLLLLRAGRSDLAREVYQRALRMSPQDRALWEAYAWLLNYAHDATPQEAFEAHVRLGELIDGAAGSPRRPHVKDPDPERPLRIGLLSPDFRAHSVSSFLEPLLAAHDRERYRMTCYHLSATVDDVTERLRPLAEEFVQADALSKTELARRIRDAETDILIDLAGHTKGSGIDIMALRPAPVQVTYLGYLNTTGLRSIDWRIVDTITDPPGAEAVATERLWRLDPCHLCYRPLPEAPPIGPPPGELTGRITFAMVNGTNKVTPFMVAVWCRILHEIPSSRLLVKTTWGERGAQGWIARKFLAEFEAHGVDASRIELAPYAPSRREYLEMYNRADVCLDPFPHIGVTTTCEALWMGAPVVTMVGDRHISRVNASLMSALGLSELATGTPDEYVGVAVALARDPARRAALRRELRGRMNASALRDEAGFVQRFQDALREMWRQRCAAK